MSLISWNIYDYISELGSIIDVNDVQLWHIGLHWSWYCWVDLSIEGRTVGNAVMGSYCRNYEYYENLQLRGHLSRLHYNKHHQPVETMWDSIYGRQELWEVNNTLGTIRNTDIYDNMYLQDALIHRSTCHLQNSSMTLKTFFLSSHHNCRIEGLQFCDCVVVLINNHRYL